MKKIQLTAVLVAATLISTIFARTFAPRLIDENPFLTELVEQLTSFWREAKPEKLYLQLDRNQLNPGDNVWFKASVRDAATLKASEKSDVVYAELLSPKGSVEQKLTLLCTDGGVGGTFHIDENAAGGLWKIKIYTLWGNNTNEFLAREFNVQRVVLPHLNMRLDYEREAYGAGDNVTAKISLKTLTKAPLANYAFTYTASVDGAQISTNSGTTDADGNANVQFKLPNELASNDGLANIMIQYQGQTESISRSIPIVLNKIDLQFLPEGGDMVDNIHGRVGFKALDEFGKPADVEGEIRDSKNNAVARFETYHAGMGALDFTPKNGETYTATISRPRNIKQTYVLPSALERGFALRIENKAKTLTAVVSSTESETLYLVGMQGGKASIAKVLEAKKGEQRIDIPTKDLPIGIMSFTLFDSKKLPRAERLTFVNSDKQLKINIKTDKDKYQPREKVRMSVEVRDERGLPMPGNFALAVVDDKLLSFADDRQANILAQVLLAADVKGDVFEPNYYFAKKDYRDYQADEKDRATALDYLLMTQGWRHFEWEKVLAKTPLNYAAKGEKAIFSGIVKDAIGAPISGVVISQKGTTNQTRSAANGSFALTGVRLDAPATLVFHDGIQYQNQEKAFTEYDQNIAISPILTLRGKVVDSNGQPLLGATVQVYNAADNQYVGGLTTDMEGAFAIGNIDPSRSYYIYSYYVGFNQMRTDIVPKVFNKLLTITMTENATRLEEVQITSANKADRKQVKKGIPAMNKEKSAAPKRADIAKPVAPKSNKPVADAAKPGRAVPAPPPVPSMPVIVRAHKPPLVNLDNTTSSKTISAAEIQRIPQKVGKKAAEAEDDIVAGENSDFDGVPDKLDREPNTAAGIPIDVQGRALDESGKRIEKMPDGSTREVEIPAEKKTVMLNMQGMAAIVAGNAAPDTRTGEELRFHGTRGKDIRYQNTKTFYSPQYTIREKVAARTDFRKTIYWNPSINVGRNGRAEIEFYNNDDISQFRATLEGFASDGGIGHAEAIFYTQLPFQMTCKVPTNVLTGDRVAIPLTLTNNTDEQLTGNYEVSVPNGFTPQNTNSTNALKMQLTLAAKESKTFFLNYIIADTLGQGKFQVYFADQQGQDDSFAETVRVSPRGFPVREVFSADAKQKDYAVEVNSPVSGSVKCKLVAHPNTIGEVMRGLESLLQHPGGCFEQTSSANYPNVLVLNYLRETNSQDQGIEKRCKEYLDGGYKILTGYESPGGGFDWWGRAPAHETLSAYGIMEFQDMTKVYAVDKGYIDRATQFLFTKRDNAGSWLDRGNAAHVWLGAGTVRDAYITWAMCEAGQGGKLGKELDKVYKDAETDSDAYCMALTANSLYATNDKIRAEKIMDKLLAMQDKDGSWNGKTSSVTGSSGHALKIETTALAVLAILKNKKGTPQLAQALKFLTEGKTSFGYGNTQATVLAIKAILEYTKYSKRAPEAGDLAVYVDGKKVATKHFAMDAHDDIIIDGLAQYLHGGNQKVSVRYENCKIAMPYELELDYTTTLPTAQTECKIDIDTKIAATQCKMGETVRLTTVLQNKTAELLPSTMAVIGIPAGLSPQPWQLKELRDKKICDYFELFDGYVVLHYESMQAKEKRTINLDLKADIPGEYEAPATAAFLYYTNEYKDWDKPSRITISN